MSVKLKSMRKMLDQNTLDLHKSSSEDLLSIKQQLMMGTNKSVKIITISLLLAVLVLIVLTGALLIYVGNCGEIPKLAPLTTASPSTRTIPQRYNKENNTNLLLNGSLVTPLVCIFREDWKGREPQYHIETMTKPIQKVILAHTASQFCEDSQKCSKTVQTIQNYHMRDKNQSDISYNFLIGGDGNVYFGRGFDYVSQLGLDSSIFVAFVGNFVYDKLNAKMIKAFNKLIYVGTSTSELSEDFAIVFHNQVRATQSPGRNVELIFKNYAHYLPY